jgi:uncharacterized protein (TIGR02217 family)
LTRRRRRRPDHAGFRFDVPTRFDADQIEASLEGGAAMIASVPLIEVRL